MKIITLIASLFLTLIFTGCNEAETVVKETPSFEELKKIKNENVYKLKTIEGKEITLEYHNSILTSKDLNGKITLINFFATWCPPCKKEIPIFNELVKMYPDDFQIISLLFKDSVEMEKLKEFLTELKVNFTVTVGEDNERLAKAINNVQQIPESYLFTKDGVMVEKYLGIINEKNFIETLEQLRSENK